MADFAVQRKNMVESQVRPSDVTDRRILAALLSVPRELFLPESLQAVAYMDGIVPLRPGRRPGVPARGILEARTFARMLQLAEIKATDHVLDVGCGSGYSAAVIARIAGTVVALERDAELAAQAERALGELQVSNVVIKKGALADGAPEKGPFDVIILEGAITSISETFLTQVKDGGRLVAIESSNGIGKAVIWRRKGSSFDRKAEFDAAAPQLSDFVSPVGFQF